MRTKIATYASLSALLLAVVLWSSKADYQLALNIVVSVAAMVVIAQAIQVKKYAWAPGFISIPLLFNPTVGSSRECRMKRKLESELVTSTDIR